MRAQKPTAPADAFQASCAAGSGTAGAGAGCPACLQLCPGDRGSPRGSAGTAGSPELPSVLLLGGRARSDGQSAASSRAGQMDPLSPVLLSN